MGDLISMDFFLKLTQIYALGSMYDRFTYINHENQPKVSKYIPHMDPIGSGKWHKKMPLKCRMNCHRKPSLVTTFSHLSSDWPTTSSLSRSAKVSRKVPSASYVFIVFLTKNRMEIHESLTAGSKKGGLWGWAFFLRWHAAFFLDPLSSPNLASKRLAALKSRSNFKAFNSNTTSKVSRGPMVFCSALPTTFREKKKGFPLEGKVQFAARQLCNPSWSPRRANPHPRQRRIQNCRKIAFKHKLPYLRDVHLSIYGNTICKPL